MKKTICSMIANFSAVALIALAFNAGIGGSAYAASCQSVAARVAASQGGVVLSARAQGNKCKIKILIKPKNGPPKQKTIVVSK